MPLRIFVGIPTIGEALTAQLGALLFTLGEGSSGAFKFTLKILSGSSTISYPVDYQRNKLVEAFLVSDCDWLWMIDSDSLPSENSVELVRLLATTKYDAIAGIYPILSLTLSQPPEMVWSVYEANEDWSGYKPKSLMNDSPLVEADAAGTGCILIRRSVFEDKALHLAEGCKPPAIFRTPHAPNGRVEGTEDLEFFRRYHASGRKLLAHTGVRWGHLKTYDLMHSFNLGAQAFTDGVMFERAMTALAPSIVLTDAPNLPNESERVH